MVYDDDLQVFDRVYQFFLGLGVVVSDFVQNLGFLLYCEWMIDKDLCVEKVVVCIVYMLFYFLLVGSIWVVVVYMLFLIESGVFIDI